MKNRWIIDALQHCFVILTRIFCPQVIVLSVLACSYAAKLDRTYLPPSSAASAGGSPGALTAPSGPGFGPNAAGTGGQQGGPSFGQAPSGQTGFNQPSGPSYGQSGPGLNQPAASPAFKQSGPTGQAGFGQDQSFGQNFGQGPQQPERPQASADRNAEILKYDNQNDGETFAYSFETSNGIAAEESGVATNGVQAQGGYSYTGDDGQFYKISYTADENGYLPQGDHLPTPHPIPEEILKSIETNAAAAAAGTQEGK